MLIISFTLYCTFACGFLRTRVVHIFTINVPYYLYSVQIVIFYFDEYRFNERNENLYENCSSSFVLAIVLENEPLGSESDLNRYCLI